MRLVRCAVVALLFALVLAPVSALALQFVAQLDPDQVVPLPGGADPSGVATSSGVLTMDLNAAQDRLDYRLEFTGLSLLTQVKAIHIHLAAPGANGPHALNIFGLPGQDDDDLVVDVIGDVLTGSWDDGDENLAVGGAPDVRDPADSIKLSDALASLLAGDAYIAVHSEDFPLPNSAELRGQINVVPEPGTAALLMLGLGILGRRRRF